MECMASSPEIARSQGHDTDGSADPIVCKTAVEERPVAAVVLNHEEADEAARRGCHQQQASPITMVKSALHIRAQMTTKGTAVITSSNTPRALFGSR